MKQAHTVSSAIIAALDQARWVSGRTMGKVFSTLVAIVLISMAAASCARAAETPAAYSTVIDAYRRAMAEHWEDDWDKLEEHGIPIEFRYGGAEPEVVASLIDVDADGSPELVIYDASNLHMLWNAYTIKDGAAVRLFVGKGRDRWYITRSEDGSYLFENEGSSGASNGVNLYYLLKCGELVFVHGVIYDEDSMNDMNGEYALTGDESKIVAHAPWFTTTTDPRGQYEYADLVPISEAEARAITDAYESHRIFPEGERITR